MMGDPNYPEDMARFNNDPRSPNYDDPTEYADFESKRDDIVEERFKDLNGWFIESITESSNANLAELRDAIQSGDNLKAGDIVSDMVYRYITPSDETVLEELNQEPDCD